MMLVLAENRSASSLNDLPRAIRERLRVVVAIGNLPARAFMSPPAAKWTRVRGSSARQ